MRSKPDRATANGRRLVAVCSRLPDSHQRHRRTHRYWGAGPHRSRGAKVGSQLGQADVPPIGVANSRHGSFSPLKRSSIGKLTPFEGHAECAEEVCRMTCSSDG
jgi:hypothetical protein